MFAEICQNRGKAIGTDWRYGRHSADLRSRVKKHALQAAFLHGLFGNRYTKDERVGALTRLAGHLPAQPGLSAIQTNYLLRQLRPTFIKHDGNICFMTWSRLKQTRCRVDA